MNDQFKSVIRKEANQQKLPINSSFWECALVGKPEGTIASTKHYTRIYTSTNFYKPIALCINLIPLTN